MAVGVEHALLRQNAVGDDDVAPGALDGVHVCLLLLFYGHRMKQAAKARNSLEFACD